MAEETAEVGTEEVELTDRDLDVIDKVEEEFEENRSDDDEKSVVVDDAGVDASAASEKAEKEEVKQEDELAARARSYGLDPDAFTSREALEQNVGAVEQSYAQFYAYQQQQQQQAQSQYPVQQNQDQQQSVAPVEFKIDLDEDYDEGLRDAINGMADKMSGHFNNQMEVLAQHILNQQQYVGRFANQEQMLQQQAELDDFDTAVQSLESGNLFGSSKYQETETGSEAAQNMEQLYDRAYTLASGYVSQGQEVPPMKELVEQAYRVVFSNEVDNQNRQRFNNRMRKASNRRLGGGRSTKETGPLLGEDEIANDPVLKDAYNGFLKENGDL
jgi:hypothetical protein